MGDSSKVILASASPRRRQLLGATGIEFEVIESRMPERHQPGEPPRDYALRMARDKARAVSSRFPDAIVVGADTIVVCENQILEKPADATDARRMLAMLSSRTHTVVTAFALARAGKILESSPVESRVTFRKLTDAEISDYIATGEPFDKAGGYGIQGIGGGFISHVEGSRDNVMGLPTDSVVAALARYGVAVAGQNSIDHAIAERLTIVRARIGAAAHRAHRDAASIRLLLASKTQPSDAIRAAVHAGARDFGENYVQEAIAKRAELADLSEIRWHLIGHLQTNKAKTAASAFALIHGVDSVRVAESLVRAQPSPRVHALIEVNLAAEASKSGVAPDGVAAILDAVRGKLEIDGLMTIPPRDPRAEASRPYFARLRELRDRLAMQSGYALSELSMGMTDDFEIAIEEGATIVRIGRAVFGERVK
jgi:MAF protein